MPALPLPFPLGLVCNELSIPAGRHRKGYDRCPNIHKACDDSHTLVPRYQGSAASAMIGMAVLVWRTRTSHQV